MLTVLAGCAEGFGPRDNVTPRQDAEGDGVIDAAAALPIGSTDGVRGYVPVTASHNAFQVDLVESAEFDAGALDRARLELITDEGTFEVRASPSVYGGSLMFALYAEELPPPGIGHFELIIDGERFASPRSLYFARPGDANLDMVFDSSDLVEAHSAGKYDVDEDATFAEGDWDGDGRFTSSDLVAALAFGGYEEGEPIEGAETLVHAPGLHWVDDLGSGAAFRSGPSCEISCGLVVKDFADPAADANLDYLRELQDQGLDDTELNIYYEDAMADPHSGSVTPVGNNGAGCTPTWTVPPVGDPESHVKATFNWCGAGFDGDPGYAGGGVTAAYDCHAEQQAAIECIARRTGPAAPSGDEADPCEGAKVSALFELDIDLSAATDATLDFDNEEGDNATADAKSWVEASLFQSTTSELSTGLFEVRSQSLADGDAETCTELAGKVAAYGKVFCRAVAGSQVSANPIKLESWCAVESGTTVEISLEAIKNCIASDGLESHFTMTLIDDGLHTSIEVPAGGVKDLGRSTIDYHTEYTLDRPRVLIDDGILWDEYAYQKVYASTQAEGRAGAYISSFIPSGLSDSLEVKRLTNRVRRPRLFDVTDAEGNPSTRMYFEKIANGAYVSCPEPNIPQ